MTEDRNAAPEMPEIIYVREDDELRVKTTDKNCIPYMRKDLSPQTAPALSAEANKILDRVIHDNTENFGKPSGSYSLSDAIIQAGKYGDNFIESLIYYAGVSATPEPPPQNSAAVGDAAEALEWLSGVTRHIAKETDEISRADPTYEQRRQYFKRSLQAANTIRARLQSPQQSVTMDDLRVIRSLVKYSEWQMTEGANHHPTLPSAVSAAKAVINRVERAAKGGPHE